MDNEQIEMTSKATIYTIIDLCNDIQDQVEAEEINFPDSKKNSRDKEYKLKVLQYILSLIKRAPRGYDNPFERAVEIDVEQNSSLFSFNYFLSSQRNFDYSWSYLRNQLDEYKIFLFQTGIFLIDMIRNINKMRPELGEMAELKLVFNDLFEVSYQEKEPYAKTEIVWENFSHISNLKKDYYLSAIVGETTLITVIHKVGNDATPFIKNVKNLYKNVNRDLK